MPIFYFDFGDSYGGPSLDNDGEDFPTVDMAKREALKALGDASKDFTRNGSDGRLSIRIRDHEGAILEVSATFETKSIR